MPHFEYRVGQPARSITPASPQWRVALPMDRSERGGGGARGQVSYGDYFTAVRDYLTNHEIAVPAGKVGSYRLADAAGLCIHLVKHGAFYHPALVLAQFAGARLPLAVNVAVSAQGRMQLPVEVASLRLLGRKTSVNWFPRVYDEGSGRAGDHPAFPMFTGQWFCGFKEMHRTKDNGAEQQWAMWEADGGTRRLDAIQVASFFRQALLILTGCFDPHTLSAILEWHHAAGDFVVRKTGRGLSVRLITVRRYAPLFAPASDEAIDLRMLLEGLAVFWLRTSLWMRLDRLDGVGEMVWAEDRAVASMWQGFMQGVRRMARSSGFPRQFASAVRRFLGAYQAQEWLHLGTEIVLRFPTESEEARLMKLHLPRHAVGRGQVNPRRCGIGRRSHSSGSEMSDRTAGSALPPGLLGTGLFY